MIRFLLSLPARLKLWAAGIFAAIAAIGAVYAKGWADRRARDAVQDLKAHQTTVENVLAETVSDDPAADIRRRMHDRAQ